MDEPWNTTPYDRESWKGGYEVGIEHGNTPNVVIENPRIRKVLSTTLGVAAVLIGAVATVDAASPDFDWTAYTGPAAVGIAFLIGGFNLAVVNANIPKA